MRRILALLIISTAAVLYSCAKDNEQPWVESKDVDIMAYKSDPENGKQFLDIIYENIGSKNIRSLKIELVETSGTKVDTVIKIITPETVFKPKDKHLAKRPIGEQAATFNDVKVSRIWVVYDK